MPADFLLFVIIGFAAQLIDGAIGMAYGLASTTILLSMGVAPATASASVHTAEVFTTAASSLSHWRLGNVDKTLFRRLVIPGVIGGACGAYLLSSVPGETIRPFVGVYLAIMGAVILWRALRRRYGTLAEPKQVEALGLAGGFLDAVGGGGWGPIVASSLISQGKKARLAIGSTNAAEFLVTVTISGTFVLTIGLELWPIILGLTLGGMLAAPFAAYVTRSLPDRPLMIIVGVIITLLSIRELVRSLG
ncbi:MAG TPA: sulfite exporter TauE/SafE family protein [Beijerinckiaceae bacterium]|nr:Sulfite exporter TauE/SafE [Microvirga sp.]HZB38989.1 sulfite exporter TauE/SafE family protein [Beijerinckiaceae bacterium]